MTPQQIDEARTRAEIERRVKLSCTGLPFDEAERQALAQHPPINRATQPDVKRQPKRKKHVLP